MLHAFSVHVKNSYMTLLFNKEEKKGLKLYDFKNSKDAA